MVIRSAEQAAAEVWVPGEAIALLLVSSQTQIGGAFSRRIFSINKINVTKTCAETTLLKTLQKMRFVCKPTRLWGVLCVIKDQHVAGGGLGGNDARILRHVAGSVNFSLVVDLDLNFYLPTYRPKASELWHKAQQIHETVVANDHVSNKFCATELVKWCNANITPVWFIATKK